MDIDNSNNVCPFCGKSEYLEVQDNFDDSTLDDFIVWCHNCDIYIPETIWHQRPVENKLKERVHMLEKQLDDLIGIGNNIINEIDARSWMNTNDWNIKVSQIMELKRKYEQIR